MNRRLISSKLHLVVQKLIDLLGWHFQSLCCLDSTHCLWHCDATTKLTNDIYRAFQNNYRKIYQYYISPVIYNAELLVCSLALWVFITWHVAAYCRHMLNTPLNMNMQGIKWLHRIVKCNLCSLMATPDLCTFLFDEIVSLFHPISPNTKWTSHGVRVNSALDCPQIIFLVLPSDCLHLAGADKASVKWPGGRRRR